jgi:adenine-specific DNA-methyltransferase
MATGVTSKNRKQDAPFQLDYEGKQAEQDVLRLPPVEPTSWPVGAFCKHGELYQGDNLGVMLWLLESKSLRGKVRCVYIDPPYSTAQAFVDREANPAYEDLLSGAKFIEFLRQRLIVLRELLANDGSIFVHLDQTMVFEIKLVMDEVFGRSQFRNFVTRKKCNTKNYTRNSFGNISDHILFYSKSDDYVWHRQYDEWSEERFLEEYPYVEKDTGRRYKKVPIHAPGVRNGETGKEWRGRLPPRGKHWQFTPSKLDELDAAGEIYWSPNGNPRRLVFFDPNKGIPAQDIWMQYKDAHNQNVQITGYPTEKNLDLLTRIVSATTNPDDLVLDCFCGSGTTLEASARLGRRFIGIDSGIPAIEATLKRLEFGREPMGDFVEKRGLAPSGKNRRKKNQPTLFRQLDE